MSTKTRQNEANRLLNTVADLRKKRANESKRANSKSADINKIIKKASSA